MRDVDSVVSWHHRLEPKKTFARMHTHKQAQPISMPPARRFKNFDKRSHRFVFPTNKRIICRVRFILSIVTPNNPSTSSHLIGKFLPPKRVIEAPTFLILQFYGDLYCTTPSHTRDSCPHLPFFLFLFWQFKDGIA